MYAHEILCVSMVVLVCASRVYLEYHSVAQVVTGAVAGIAVFVAWARLESAALRPLCSRGLLAIAGAPRPAANGRAPRKD